MKIPEADTTSPHTSPTQQALAEHYAALLPFDLKVAFADDTNRSQRWHQQCGGLLFDFSKHWLTSKTLELWRAHAEACHLPAWRAALFGSSVDSNSAADIDWLSLNNTESRAALHTALRSVDNPNADYTADIKQTVTAQQAATDAAVHAIQTGQWRSASNKVFTDVIHLGTGGSHLGPELLIQALPQADDGLTVHFLPNLDSNSLHAALRKIDPQSTLIVLASKSFGTQEAMLNFAALQAHFSSYMSVDQMLAQQVLAITANPDKATAMGISAEHTLTFSDWVGGRYSIWSAIGATLALYAGHTAFAALRAGAAEMDDHFLTMPLNQNIPFIAASIACGYRNFAQLNSQAVLVYADRLQLLPSYLQQLDMESNGKRVQRDGNDVSVASGAVLWGGTGTNAQHAVMQLVHQGSDVIPVDFIGVLPTSSPSRNTEDAKPLQRALLANLLAQSSALMQGQDCPESPHKQMPGNRPSTSILLDDITPQTLGTLLAFYEHKVFCQAVMWNINPFDQWGVELGKSIAGKVLQTLEGNDNHLDQFDASTAMLLNHIKPRHH